jgi:hypothetical protein
MSKSAANPVKKGGGAPLAASLRRQMESRFGESFADVRVHDNDQAHASAAELNAKAYTHGTDIVFSAQRFDPSSLPGMRLLAHELAHVVQQRRGGGVPDPSHDSGTEAGARAAAQAVTSGSGPVSVAGASAVGVAREPEDDEEKRQALPAMSVLTQRPPEVDAAPPEIKAPAKKDGGAKAAKASAGKAKGTLAELNVPFAVYSGPEWNHIAGGGEGASSRVSIARMSKKNKEHNTEATAGIDFLAEHVKTNELVLGEQKAVGGSGEFRSATAITTYLEANVLHSAEVLQKHLDDGKVKDAGEVKRLQGTIDRLRKTHEALRNGREGKPASLPDGVVLELTSLGGEGKYIGADFVKRLGDRYKKNPAFVEHLLSRTRTRVLKPGQAAPEVKTAMEGLNAEGHDQLERIKAGKTKAQWKSMKSKAAQADKAAQAAKAKAERTAAAKQAKADKLRDKASERAALDKAGEDARLAKLKELQAERRRVSRKKPTKTQAAKENVEANKAGRAAKKQFQQERIDARAKANAEAKVERDAAAAKEAAATKQRADERAARKAENKRQKAERTAAHKEVAAMGEMTPETWGKLPKEQRQRLERLAAGDKALAAKLNQKVNAKQTKDWHRYEAEQQARQARQAREAKMGKAAKGMNMAAGGVRAYDAYQDARDKGDGVPMALAKGGLTMAENVNPLLGAAATVRSRMQTETLPDGRTQQYYGEDAGDAFFGTLGETIGGYIVPGKGVDQLINGAANLIGAGDDHFNRGKPAAQKDKASVRTATDLAAEMTPSRLFSSTVGAGARAYYDIGKAMGGQTSGVDKFADDGLRGKLGSVIQPWAMAADFLGNLGGDSPGAALEKTIKRTEGTTLKKLGDASGDAMFELGQSKEAKAGKYGAPVQGISMALGMTTDMIAGRSFEQAINAAAEAGKGSTLEKVGSALGEAAYVGVERGKEVLDKDLPELKEKARQAYGNAQRALSDWWHK